MYIHMGNGKYLRTDNIVGVFDMDTATVCVATRRFLADKEKENKVSSADEELPKSFLLLSDENGTEKRKTRRKKRRQGRKKKEEAVVLSKFSSPVLFGRTAITASLAETLGNVVFERSANTTVK